MNSLNNDLKNIRNQKNMLAFSDKNKWFIPKRIHHNILLHNNFTKSYKKVNNEILNSINKEAATIIKNNSMKS